MKAYRPHRGVSAGVLLVAACVMVAPRASLGQGRGKVAIGNIGSLGNSSGFGASASFRSYSYGLGGLGGGGSAGVLQGSTNSYSFNRKAGAGGAATTSSGLQKRLASAAAGNRVRYQANDYTINTAQFAGTSAANAFRELGARRVVFGQTLRGVFGLGETTLQPAAPLTTLAPPETNRGQYAMLLRSGESAMKIRQYGKAAKEFDRAGRISGQAPETLLSMAHAAFGRGHYAVMAHNLRQAIKVFPELATVDIQLRKFFRSSEEFIALRNDLMQRAKDWPNDANVKLALAYVQWFDGAVDEAVAALRQGVQCSTNPALTEAMEQFWESCLSTGKVSGTLLTERTRTRPARRPRQAKAEKDKTETVAQSNSNAAKAGDGDK